MDREEDVQHIAERNLGWVKRDLRDLGVAGGSGAHRLITRVRHMAARVARHHLRDAAQLLEYRFETPEAAAGEGSDFRHEDNLAPARVSSRPVGLALTVCTHNTYEAAAFAGDERQRVRR